MESQLQVGPITKGFSRLASRAATAAGSPWMFLFACVTIVVWAVLGAKFHYSDAWQLVVNSWTNIATFLVVFLIQNSQNRDSKAINLKLDELLVAGQHAREDLINVERLTDQELEAMAQRYDRIRQEWERRRKHSPAERRA